LTWKIVIEGLQEASRLILTGDKVIIEITLRSIQIAINATLLAAVIGIPISIIISMNNFTGKRIVKLFFNAMVGVPTVTLGLFLYTLFSRSGPLGSLSLLYSTRSIVIGQAILIAPLMISFIVNAIESKDNQLRDLVRTLGTDEAETSLAILREAYSGVSLAIVSSFNRAFAELGIATMLGANISGITRVLTTAIALETAKGELGLGFALSFILLAIVVGLNFLVGNLRGDH
jgi:tungstate transport system permease protein